MRFFFIILPNIVNILIMFRYIDIFVLYLFVIQTCGQYATEGDICVKNGINGVCTNIRNCPSALHAIHNLREYPMICSYSNKTPIVCCMDSTKTTVSESDTPTKNLTGHDSDTEEKNSKRNDQCEPIPASLTAPKTGQKAFDKCVEYQQKFIYPCTSGVDGNKKRANSCHHNSIELQESDNQLAVEGIYATKNEFPHLVLLGYGININDLQWLCAGSLISERFILTLGHCGLNRQTGAVSYGRVGALSVTESYTSDQLYPISDIIKHPDQQLPHRYNDIMLLKTSRDMVLNEFTVPACLDVGDLGDYDRTLATGWGATGSVGHLIKVAVRKLTTTECSDTFSPSRLLKNGIDNKTQICYGYKNVTDYLCQKYIGGIIQLRSPKIHCMYTVVGLPSFGVRCGYLGSLTAYTRVAGFIPWIESIVWP